MWDIKTWLIILLLTILLCCNIIQFKFIYDQGRNIKENRRDIYKLTNYENKGEKVWVS